MSKLDKKNTFLNNWLLPITIFVIVFIVTFAYFSSTIYADEIDWQKPSSTKIEENQRVHFYLNRAWVEGDSDLDKIKNYFHHRGFELLKSVMVGNEKTFKYYVYIVSKKTHKTKYGVVIFDNPWYGAPADICMESPAEGTIKEDVNGMGCTPFGAMRYYYP